MIPCFTIRDPESGTYFKTWKGKQVWFTANAAEVGYNKAHLQGLKFPRFADQSKLVIEKSVVISEALYNELMDNLFRMKGLEK